MCAFSQACHNYVMQHPGRAVTANVLASLVGDAWLHASTPLKILSGFRKCGLQPFNPGEVSDRQLGPSKGVTPSPNPQQDTHCQESPPFSPEKIALFEKRYQEGYNDLYKVWLRLYHTESVCSVPSNVSTSSECKSTSDTSAVLSEILTLQKPPERQGRHKRATAMNQQAVCTEDEVLEAMKKKERKKC